MNDTEKALHYSCINEFSKQYRKNVIDINHLLNDGKIHVPKLIFTDGGEGDENFFGWKFKKEDVTYLIPDTNSKGEKVSLKDILPLIPTQSIDGAFQSKVYTIVRSYKTVKFRREKKMSFKELVDILSNISHTNPTHKKLNVMMSLSSLLDRAYYRYCTPPGFGKDSTVDILGNLIGNCSTLENPTIAKLEYEADNRSWLAVNEIVDIKSDQWQGIEQFLLAAGAFKPLINKRTRSGGSGVGEEIDVSDFSISIMYNDITDYPKFKRKRYFDLITKTAVLDRFPAFRLYGRINADFEKLHDNEISKIVTKNWDFYKNLIYTLTYYKKFLNNEWHGFDTSKLVKVPYRWKANINKLLKVIDVYSSSQEEFDSWIDVVNNSIIDYRSMMNYKSFLESLRGVLSRKDFIAYTEKLKNMDTFTDCIKDIDNKINNIEQDKLKNYW